MFGGDKAVEERPDLGWLMKRMQVGDLIVLLIVSVGTSVVPKGFSLDSVVAPLAGLPLTIIQLPVIMMSLPAAQHDHTH